MSALPADTLRNRTFIGLLIAQFLAAFNDQAIHVSAMFFAIGEKTLTEAKAISLMPILFYAPWALFVTLAGYFADRFSKRSSLVFWKMAEVGIMVVATFGFWFGVHGWAGGPWVVLSCVFLMGTHSAFFVPAKYGAMPEILQSQLLSRGNGILESLSFLAVILGTVGGGLLYDFFDDFNEQYYIGLILLVLAVVGALASLLIQPIPAANPHRPFPRYCYGPLPASLRTLFRSRPLALAVVGIAFFTFMLAFMRATMYMLGESQNPQWSESYTSVIVGTTALGIGFGSLLAGILSGRKVELGLVPLGAVGMALAAAAAALAIDHVTGLVTAIIALGFFTGFYLVPLFTLLQHRAPKTSKGDVVATSNFVNVTGAILASVLFFLLTFAFQRLGLAQRIDPQDRYAAGTLKDIQFKDGRPTELTVVPEDGDKVTIPPKGQKGSVIEITGDIPTKPDPEQPVEVLVSHYHKHVDHYLVRLEGTPLEPVYDNSHLPQYLLAGAGVMALLTLGLLVYQMPDLLARALWVLRKRGEIRLHVVGTDNVPVNGPVVMATNCRDETSRRDVVSATERPVRFVQTKLTDERLAEVLAEVRSGTVLALTEDAWATLLTAVQARLEATYVPVYHGPALAAEGNGAPPKAGTPRVAFGPPLPAHATPAEVRAAIRSAGAMTEEEH
jgi:MFS family permease